MDVCMYVIHVQLCVSEYMSMYLIYLYMNSVFLCTRDFNMPKHIIYTIERYIERESMTIHSM